MHSMFVEHYQHTFVSYNQLGIIGHIVDPFRMLVTVGTCLSMELHRISLVISSQLPRSTFSLDRHRRTFMHTSLDLRITTAIVIINHRFFVCRREMGNRFHLSHLLLVSYHF